MEDTKVDCAVDRAESRAEVQLTFILRSFRTRPSPPASSPPEGPICFCHIGVRPSSGWPCVRPSTAHAKVPPTSKGHLISVGPNSHVCRRDSPCRIRYLEGGLFHVQASFGSLAPRPVAGCGALQCTVSTGGLTPAQPTRNRDAAHWHYRHHHQLSSPAGEWTQGLRRPGALRTGVAGRSE